jgi:hypothetical protein
VNIEDDEGYSSDVAPDHEFDVSDLDVALYRVLEGGIDYISQLSAIRDLLQRQNHADRLLKDQIERIEEFARKAPNDIANQRAIDEWIDHLHASTYQDAAHSMAAVGMLGPLVESILYQSLRGIGRILGTDMDRFGSHPRWQQPTEKTWDCHFYYAKSGKLHKNLVDGVFQIAEAVGLSAHFPPDFKRTLQSLFAYRNKMFHGGFEWSNDERQRFHRQIKDEHWPQDWFTMATQDGEPWIFYLTDTFIDHCLVTVDGFLCGLGAFARDI